MKLVLRRRRHAALPLGLAIVLAAVGLSACGSAGGSGTTSGANSAAVREACNFADKATKPVSFVTPGPSVRGAAMKGKSIWLIDLVSSDTVSAYTAALTQAASSLGATVHSYNAQGSIANAATGIRQAIGQKADVIVDVAITPQSLSAPLKEAERKGIITIDYENANYDAPELPFMDARVSWDYTYAGKVRVAQAICQTNGNLKLGLLTSSGVDVAQAELDGIKAAMKTWCSSTCEMNTIDVAPAQWVTGLPTATRDIINRANGMNYLMCEFDSMQVYAYPALRAANPSGDIKTNGLNLDFDFYNDIASGHIQGDIGVSLSWLGYATVDQALRLLNHQKPLTLRVPTRLVTPEIAQQVNLKSSDGYANGAKKIFGDSFISGYQSLWK